MPSTMNIKCLGITVNTLNIPPEEYDRKIET